jgi:hypothetical protein
MDVLDGDLAAIPKPLGPLAPKITVSFQACVEREGRCLTVAG